MKYIYKLQLMIAIIALFLGSYVILIYDYTHFEAMVISIMYWILANTFFILKRAIKITDEKEMAK